MGIVTSGLVMYYDMYNGYASYVGPVSTNLATNANDFTTAAWTPSQTTITLNPSIRIPGPSVFNGYVWEMNENTTVSGQYNISSAVTTTLGTTYTVSVYAKAKERSQVTLTMFGEGYSVFDLATGTVASTGGNTCSMTDFGNGWYRCAATITKTNATAGAFIGIWNGNANYVGTVGRGVYVCKAQVEVGQLTPWTGSSRTTTNNLYDMVTRTAFTTTSLTYTTDNLFSFNGTTDYMTVSSIKFPFTTSPGSMSVWINMSDLSEANTVFSYGQRGGTNGGRALFIGPGNLITYSGGSAVGALELIVSTSIKTGFWYNVVGVFDGTTVLLYLNGVLIGSSALAWNTGNFGLVYYGQDLIPPNNNFNGKIANAAAYNVALTSEDVMQNFASMRGRFGV
jgi:hypothetical protein